MDEPKVVGNADAVCDRLGDLAAAAVPGAERAPDARQWAAIATKLERRTSWRPRWRAAAWCGLGLVFALVWFSSRRTLEYRAENCGTAADGTLFAASAGAIAFADGSRIDLGAGTRMRVAPLRFAAGAELALGEGEARVAVVHRAGARWTVLAGPFHVEVTGTRFTVRWSSQPGSFHLALQEGEVRVSGGALAGPTILRSGQTLEADARGSTAGPTGAPAAPPPADEQARSPARSAEPPAAAGPPSPNGRVQPPAAQPRRHNEASPTSPRAEPGAHAETPRPAPTPAPASAAAPSVHPAPAEPAGNAEPALAMSPPAPPPPPVALPPPAAGVRVSPAPRRITIDADGSLAGGLGGYLWFAGGADTNFSTPAQRRAHARLAATGGQFCVRGTIAGLRCVNENLPQMRCNWEHNWGAQIGFLVKADGTAWGQDAAGAIALEFHGRSTSYRLNAHRHSDPPGKVFCIEDYQSGQSAKPAMFKSECWADRGETLADFKDVDAFNLHLLSSTEYRAFRFCLAGIELRPAP
jgi:hypothetical protein